MKKREEIATLIDKFMEGCTTIAEEQELYAWFRNNDVDEAWQPFKEMFAWYDEGMPKKSEKRCPVPKSKMLKISRKLWTATAVAAVVVLALMTIFYRSAPQSIYEGSYIIEQGARCDNIVYIEGDIKALLERADNIEAQADMLLAWVDGI